MSHRPCSQLLGLTSHYELQVKVTMEPHTVAIHVGFVSVPTSLFQLIYPAFVRENGPLRTRERNMVEIYFLILDAMDYRFCILF